MPEATRKGILDAAAAAVLGAREQDYGTPEDNFARIARLWTAHLVNTGRMVDGDPVPIQPHDVALMLDLVKTARLANSPTHLDSWIDKAGYSACGGEVAR